MAFVVQLAVGEAVGKAREDGGEASEALTLEEEGGVLAFATHGGDSDQKELCRCVGQRGDERGDFCGQGLGQTFAGDRRQVGGLPQELGDATRQPVGQPSDIDGLRLRQ